MSIDSNDVDGVTSRTGLSVDLIAADDNIDIDDDDDDAITGRGTLIKSGETPNRSIKIRRWASKNPVRSRGLNGIGEDVSDLSSSWNPIRMKNCLSVVENRSGSVLPPIRKTGSTKFCSSQLFRFPRTLSNSFRL